MISDEVEDFVREIKIDSDATFFDLHKAILQSVAYADNQMTSFFICDEDWEKHQEITLENMDTTSEEDNYVMASTRLSELIEDEQQKLIYVFDPLHDRVFFIELVEMLPGKDLKRASISRKEGRPPKQELDLTETLSTATGSIDVDENFYGDQDFNLDEFDPDSFDFDQDALPGGRTDE